MKRSKLVTIAVLLLVFSLSLVAGAADNTKAPAKTPFEALSKLGYIQNLKASDTVTRLEALTALLKVTAKEPDASAFEGTETFFDSDEDVILYALENGIVMGDGNGFFAPSRKITLDEMLIMSLRILGYENISRENVYELAKEARIYTYSEYDGYYYYLTAERMAQILWNMMSATAENEDSSFADQLISMGLIDTDLYSQVLSEIKYKFGDIIKATISFWEEGGWSGIISP